MATIEDDYWDNSEFKFFNTLEDEDKLLYLYDLLIGADSNGFFELDGSEEMDFPDFEFEFDDNESEIRQEVTAIYDDDGYLALTGARIEVLEKVAHDMMMNGVILTDREDRIAESGLALITYNVVGTGPPISVN